MGMDVIAHVGYGIVLRGKELAQFCLDHDVEMFEDFDGFYDHDNLYPHLRFNTSTDWEPSDAHLLVSTVSSNASVDLWGGSRELPVRCGTLGTPEELQSLQELQKRYSPDQEPAIHLGAHISC